jgi:hypothetical protein
MKSIRSVWRTLMSVALVLAGWCGACSMALAQKPGAPPESTASTDYTIAYFLLILGVALGLVFVLKSSNRRDRDRPEGYVEKNVLKQE